LQTKSTRHSESAQRQRHKNQFTELSGSLRVSWSLASQSALSANVDHENLLRRNIIYGVRELELELGQQKQVGTWKFSPSKGKFASLETSTKGWLVDGKGCEGKISCNLPRKVLWRLSSRGGRTTAALLKKMGAAPLIIA
jgi:hypothetical protein